MEFGCSVCEYTSSKKENVVRHINRKIACGKGLREIIEIPIEIKCQYCEKKFSTYVSLKGHEKHNCSKKDKLKDVKIKELEEKTKELERQLKEKPTTINQTIEVPQEKRNSMYLLQEREFFNLKQPVYKIGITETVRNRMGQYPKGSKIIFIMPVDGDPEQLCLVKFRSQFIPRTDVGSEYFQGDADLMVKTVIECCT